MEKDARAKYFLKPKGVNPIAWCGRFILFLLSSGYLYPHCCTENMDMKLYEADLAKDASQKS